MIDRNHDLPVVARTLLNSGVGTFDGLLHAETDLNRGFGADSPDGRIAFGFGVGRLSYFALDHEVVSIVRISEMHEFTSAPTVSPLALKAQVGMHDSRG